MGHRSAWGIEWRCECVHSLGLDAPLPYPGFRLYGLWIDSLELLNIVVFFGLNKPKSTQIMRKGLPLSIKPYC